ncbi:hypothetical protein [Streptomyces bauhiniae]|uniref:hypothetical protein n=1 Tax=Streptomyces bauhiniae TaxID=2340725 RepID=UPI0013DCDE60|nr:hypothetical protein [Streptomyces bauhiniae]
MQLTDPVERIREPGAFGESSAVGDRRQDGVKRAAPGLWAATAGGSHRLSGAVWRDDAGAHSREGR